MRNVRFGSLADMCTAIGHVRFIPNSDRESGHAQTVMSALPLKADVCGANHHVCFGPIADIAGHSISPVASNDAECSIQSTVPFPEEIAVCELLHSQSERTDHIICIRIGHEHRERQMSFEFDRTYLEEVVMLSALALFLILAFVMPA